MRVRTVFSRTILFPRIAIPVIPFLLMMGIVLLSQTGVPAAGADLANQENLIVNGDFEADATRNPPPGWVMWGAQQFKIPENYRRDETISRSGRASLRIVHPQDTAGYIVTDPETAIRPKPGVMYQIRFFARADRPCRGRFMVLGYRSIRPYVDAESPLSQEISLDTEWRECRFEIRESIDFFADSARYLILGFQAATDPKVECTVWLDDVTVTQEPMDETARLINPASLKVASLTHRLRPGSQLELVADPMASQRPALKMACGISFHRLVGFTGYPFDAAGQYNLPQPLADAIRELRLPISRVYGVGHEPPRNDLPPWPIEAAIERLAQLCDHLAIPKETMVVELEEQSANRKLEPDLWARAVRHAKTRGYGFRYWEVANEPYSQTFNAERPMGRAFATPDDYILHVKRVAQAIHEVDPKAQVGIAIAVSRPLWGNYVLKNAAGAYDFVVAHYYGFQNAYRSSYEELVLSQNYRILNQILRIQALIEAYNPSHRVYQLDTEWGMHSSGPNGERADYANRNANIVGIVHRAVRMIYYVREQPLAGASSWQMLGHSRGLGFTVLATDQPESRTMLYWLYWSFLRHVGDQLIDFDGTAPFFLAETAERDHEGGGPITPVLLTTDAKREQVFCIVANGSWTDKVPCRLVFKNWSGALVSSIYLSDDDLDGNPLLRSRERFVHDLPLRVNIDQKALMTELTGTIPPHSVVFLAIKRQP